jgi:carboxyl-terminal processing protease
MISFRPRHGLIATPLTVLAASLVMLMAAGSSDAPAASTAAADGALKPTTRQRSLAPRIAELLEQQHYSRQRINDEISGQVFERYLEMLDGQHSYFTAADIAAFGAQRNRFDDMIHSGALEPAFDMFALYEQRNRDRIRYAISLLDREPDWTVAESYEFDREKASWAKSIDELNEVWRKRVKNDALTLKLTGKAWPDIADTLRKRYERVLTRVDQIKRDEVFEVIMNAFASVADPHTNYFSPVNTEENRIQMSLSYEGIGASLLLQDDYVTIGNLIPGGPAAVAAAASASSALQVNDRILGVAQGATGPFTEVIGWRLEDVVQLIRGKNGTLVRLQVLPAGAAPGGAERLVSLARGKVTLDNQAAKKQRRLVTMNGRQFAVGVISVPGFYEDIQERSNNNPDYRSTTRDVRRLIDELKAEGPLDALLLDLRADGGGFLPEAQGLTGLFIDRGPVVQLKGTDGRIEVLDDPETGVSYDGPLTVLVDRTSASASEIFAGAIQDYHRGLILGQTTFGKGTVQNQVRLDLWQGQSTNGQINLTVGKFYRVTGESTQHRGVEPDIALPSYIGKDEIGESSLEHALPWDRIAPARFTPLPQQEELVKKLAEAEKVRAASDPDYRWLIDSVAAAEKSRALKSLSLNLADRQREREALDAMRLSLENARRKALQPPQSAQSAAPDPAAVVKALEPVKAVSDIKAEDVPDVVLAQAVSITADMASRSVPPRQAAQKPRAAGS